MSHVVFEENSIPRTEFHPVGLPYGQPHYGLMTLHGIPKPAWRGFQLLNTHAGSHTVPTTVTHGPGQSTGGNQSVIAATTTVNATMGKKTDLDKLSMVVGSARVFLSHWDGTHDAFAHATAVVSLEVMVSANSDEASSATAEVFMIDNTTSANLLWQRSAHLRNTARCCLLCLHKCALPRMRVCCSWGSPPKPSESQIEELKRYSEVRPHLLPWTTSGTDVVGAAMTKKTTTVIMPPNTAAVVVV